MFCYPKPILVLGSMTGRERASSPPCQTNPQSQTVKETLLGQHGGQQSSWTRPDRLELHPCSPGGISRLLKEKTARRPHKTISTMKNKEQGLALVHLAPEQVRWRLAFKMPHCYLAEGLASFQSYPQKFPWFVRFPVPPGIKSAVSHEAHFGRVCVKCDINFFIFRNSAFH